MDKRFLGILGVVIIAFIGIFALSQRSSTSSTGSNNASGQATNHVIGQNQKNVTLIEYGDYQCPVCSTYNLPVKQAVDKYSKDIQFQFIHLPLVSIHQNAFAAARAAEAAGLQNKFWEMNDKLYENQSQWSNSSNAQEMFNNYAKQLALNINQFTQDYKSSKVNDSINADIAKFDKTGKDKATPTFFLNGVYLPNSNLTDPQTGAPTAEKIGAVLQAEIDKQANN